MTIEYDLRMGAKKCESIMDYVDLVEKKSGDINLDMFIRKLVVELFDLDEEFLTRDECLVFEAVLKLIEKGFSKISPILPLYILSDIFEVCTNEKLVSFVYFIERYFSEFFKEPFISEISKGKFQFIRMTNSILKSLSGTRNSIECGKLHIMLSKFVSIYEKSGLNLGGEYSADVIDGETEIVDYEIPEFLKDENDEKDEIDNDDNKIVSTLKLLGENFFERFNEFQSYLKNPSVLFQNLESQNLLKNKNSKQLQSSTAIWDDFTNIVDEILTVFSRNSRHSNNNSHEYGDEEINSVAKKRKHSENESFFDIFEMCMYPYYVIPNRFYPNYKLLERQIFDYKFQIQVLFQILIVFTSSAFENVQKSTNKDELLSLQKNWILNTTNKIYQILQTITNGNLFNCDVGNILKNLLQKDTLYIDWKSKGCPSVVKNEQSEAKCIYNPVNFSRFDTSKSLNLGHPLITRLWNICPNNMDACKMSSRDCIPKVNEFFEEAISQLDPSEQIDEEYRMFNTPSFQWRALRLLSRNASQYFSTPYQNNMTPSQYLVTVLSSIMNCDLFNPESFQTKETQSHENQEVLEFKEPSETFKFNDENNNLYKIKVNKTDETTKSPINDTNINTESMDVDSDTTDNDSNSNSSSNSNSNSMDIIFEANSDNVEDVNMNNESYM